MATDKQIEAARRNGALSRGPATPEGKPRSSMNRLKHGRYSKYFALLHIEDPVAFDELLQDLVARYLPKDPVDYRLVAQLASVEWRKQRIDALDVAILDNEYAVQAAALKAAGKRATPEVIATLAAHSITERSKLPTFLATRAAQLVYERESILRHLVKSKDAYPHQLQWPEILQDEDANPENDASFEPDSNRPLDTEPDPEPLPNQEDQ